jgi:integrase
MARSERILNARGVAALVKPGRFADGGGLYLVIAGEGRRRWVWRYQWGKKTREMGLGSADTVALKEVRDERDKWRTVLKQGKDPISERNAIQQNSASAPTFGKIADDLIASKKTQWRNQKHRDQWEMTLKVYAKDLRAKRVNLIDTQAIVDCLKPIWTTKPETASRLRGRIEAVLDVARILGHRPAHEANPARWRGHLEKLLPKRAKLSRGHHAAMPYEMVPEFMNALRLNRGISAMALEFTILTAARSGETYGAVWGEIDFKKKVWTIPGPRMKAGREHRVPLSDAAVELLERLYASPKTGNFVFPGERPNRPLSNMAMEMVTRRLKADFTVHGFRSSFRDWIGNETHFPRDLAEMSLAHALGDETEQAYWRSDALEKRRELMEAWARYCGTPRPANVIHFKPPAAG